MLDRVTAVYWSYLRCPVGQYAYSNTDFQALGLGVQRDTGKPFKEAMRELVFPTGEAPLDRLLIVPAL